jgi:TonB family protein
MARVGRTLKPLIALTQPFPSLRMSSYLVVTILIFVWGFGAIYPPLTSAGLLVIVGMPLPNILSANKSRNEPLVLRIDARGNLSLNHQAVLRPDLEKRLRERLSRIADHWVFVDADPSLDTGDVIEAVDMIYGAGDVMVVLVTPSMKKGNSMWAGILPCEAQALQEPVLRMPTGWPTRWGYQNPLVEFVLDERGEVSSVRIRRGSGDPEIDEWVLRSVHEWKYTSTPGCGKQVVKITVPVYNW